MLRETPPPPFLKLPYTYLLLTWVLTIMFIILVAEFITTNRVLPNMSIMRCFWLAIPRRHGSWRTGGPRNGAKTDTCYWLEVIIVALLLIMRRIRQFYKNKFIWQIIVLLLLFFENLQWLQTYKLLQKCNDQKRNAIIIHFKCLLREHFG